TVAQSDNDSLRSAEEDLFAEHQLRRLRPPYELVTADRNLLIAQLISKLQELDREEVGALETNRVRPSERDVYRERLERAEKAIAAGRLRVSKQRAIVRTLTRQRSPKAKVAGEILRELERSVATSERARRYYARLLKRWS